MSAFMVTKAHIDMLIAVAVFVPAVVAYPIGTVHTSATQHAGQRMEVR